MQLERYYRCWPVLGSRCRDRRRGFFFLFLSFLAVVTSNDHQEIELNYSLCSKFQHCSCMLAGVLLHEELHIITTPCMVPCWAAYTLVTEQRSVLDSILRTNGELPSLCPFVFLSHNCFLFCFWIFASVAPNDLIFPVVATIICI